MLHFMARLVRIILQCLEVQLTMELNLCIISSSSYKKLKLLLLQGHSTYSYIFGGLQQLEDPSLRYKFMVISGAIRQHLVMCINHCIHTGIFKSLTLAIGNIPYILSMLWLSSVVKMECLPYWQMRSRRKDFIG